MFYFYSSAKVTILKRPRYLYDVRELIMMVIKKYPDNNDDDDGANISIVNRTYIHAARNWQYLSMPLDLISTH